MYIYYVLSSQLVYHKSMATALAITFTLKCNKSTAIMAL